MTVAIMQPCFAPYAGYFRLFVAADLFVIFDNVRFPRRGRIHRNQLPDHQGSAKWLTLPLAKTPRKTLIRDLVFADEAESRLLRQFGRFPCLSARTDLGHPLIQALTDLSPSPVDYIETLLRVCCEMLSLPFTVVRSSSLPIDPSFTGQDRVIAILEHLGATEYVNAPAGRKLYDVDAFSRHGIRIRFLDRHQASYFSIVARLLTESPQALSKEIRDQS